MGRSVAHAVNGANGTIILTDAKGRFVRTLPRKVSQSINTRPEFPQPAAPVPASSAIRLPEGWRGAFPAMGESQKFVAKSDAGEGPLYDPENVASGAEMFLTPVVINGQAYLAEAEKGSIKCPTPEKCRVSSHKIGSDTGKQCALRFHEYHKLAASPHVQQMWGGEDRANWKTSFVASLAYNEELDDAQAEEVAERFMWGVAKLSAEVEVKRGVIPATASYSVRDMCALKAMTPQQRLEQAESYLSDMADNAMPYGDVTGKAQSACAAQLDYLRSRGDDLTAEEVFIATSMNTRMFNARKYAMWEVQHIAGETGANVDEVWDTYQKLRGEYKAMNPKPLPPQAWYQWMEYQYGRNALMKVPPMDNASAYALWQMGEPGVLPVSDEPRQFVVLDLETTGISKTQEFVCQISMAVVDEEGEVLDTFSSYVRTRREDDGTWYVGEQTTKEGKPGAATVHGITSEQLESAPTLDDLSPMIHEISEGRTLVAHNARFDHPFLQEHLRSTKKGQLPALPIHDTLRAEQRQQLVSGDPVRHNRLLQVCERYGIPVDESKAHDAAYDVSLTGKVLAKQLKSRREAWKNAQ